MVSNATKTPAKLFGTGSLPLALPQTSDGPELTLVLDTFSTVCETAKTLVDLC